MAIALLTPVLAPYRVPLYERLAARHDIEVLCYGGGARYVPPWFTELDDGPPAAGFRARRLRATQALSLGERYDAVIAPFAGGAVLPSAYAGARRHRRPFVLWASVWSQPRSIGHAVAQPVTKHIYRHADAVLAYGEHVRRFVAAIRGRDSDVFIAPQAVEAEIFGRTVGASELNEFRARHSLPDGSLVLYAGRLVRAKGIEVLLDAWPSVAPRATLVLVGDGPLARRCEATPGARLLGTLPRSELPVAYAASELAVLPSIPTRRFKEPWGMVCNEAMHQGTPVVASDAVGAVAGGLILPGQTGLVVPPGDAGALSRAIETLLADEPLRRRLADAGKAAVSPYSYDAAVAAFELALETASRSAGTAGTGARPARRSTA